MSTGAFGYVNLLKSAADASWTREEVLTNNIANVERSTLLPSVLYDNVLLSV